MANALTPREWERVKEVFTQALELAPSGRGSFVRAQLADSPHLVTEVETLIASHLEAASFLDRPVGGLTGSPFSPPAELGPGERIDDFEIVRVLGRGAFATVYLARQLSMSRAVALKLSRNRGTEARTLAHLEHDRIVRIFSETVDVPRDLRLICMQYVPGLDLAELLLRLKGCERTALDGSALLARLEDRAGEQTLSTAALAERRHFAGLSFVETVAWIGARVAEALAHAHARGILHLDVKPANILLNPYGRVFLSDFNIALGTSDSQWARLAGALPELTGGTPAYMSPEHRRAFDDPSVESLRSIGPRADLYSLGLVLRELLGEAEASEEGRVLGRLLQKATSARPEERFVDAVSFAQALDGFLESRLVARALPSPGFLMRYSLRYPLLALITVRIVPLMIGTVIASTYCLFRTGTRLSWEQKKALLGTLRHYNSGSWPVGTAAALVLAWPLTAALRRRRREGRPEDATALQRLRARARHLPFWLAGVNVLTWFPSIAVFALASERLTGSFYLAGFLHFAIAVLFSWFVSTTYATLYAIFFAVRVLYPAYLPNLPGLRATLRSELGIIRFCQRSLPVVTGLIPLIAALLLVGLGPGELSAQKYHSFQLVLVSFITAGAAGLILSLRANQKLTAVMRALTGSGER